MTPTELQQILALWPTPFSQAEVVSEHAGFSGANIVRVRLLDQEFALRGWPPGTISPERLLGLHDFLLQCHSAGMPQFSVPIPARSRSTVVSISGREWQLEPWMPGEASFLREPSDAKLRSTMQILARFHNIAAQYRADARFAEWFFVSPQSPSPTVIERVRLIDFWESADLRELPRRIASSRFEEPLPELLKQVLANFRQHSLTIRQKLEALLPESFPVQPCLRDLWSEHVLFEKDAVTGLVDAGSCRSENPTIDLARLLGSLLPNNRIRRNQALEWYAESRPFKPEEYRLFNAFDRSEILLSGMTWLRRLILDRQLIGDVKRIAQRLQGIVVRFSELDHVS